MKNKSKILALAVGVALSGAQISNSFALGSSSPVGKDNKKIKIERNSINNEKEEEEEENQYNNSSGTSGGHAVYSGGRTSSKSKSSIKNKTTNLGTKVSAPNYSGSKAKGFSA